MARLSDNQSQLRAVNMSSQEQSLEMSRYIDLATYHAVEATHPFYLDMIDEVLRIFDSRANSCGLPRILEFGAGTGLSTAKLSRSQHQAFDAIEIDANCWQLLEQNLGGAVNCICDDAVTYQGVSGYDVAVSVFAHDHIPEDRGVQFANNIRRNLTDDGIYIMGGEILPYYACEADRRDALHAYHGYIIDTALREENFEVAKLEIDALSSGLNRVGDFKRHEKMFEAEMQSAKFKLLKKTKVGPLNRDEVGGVFVYTFLAQ